MDAVSNSPEFSTEAIEKVHEELKYHDRKRLHIEVFDHNTRFTKVWEK